jgi:hypothetical protein
MKKGGLHNFFGGKTVTSTNSAEKVKPSKSSRGKIFNIVVGSFLNLVFNLIKVDTSLLI